MMSDKKDKPDAKGIRNFSVVGLISCFLIIVLSFIFQRAAFFWFGVCLSLPHGTGLYEYLKAERDEE